jgi:menaquinone-dependent protoporphyrinogen IX oxidase
VAGGNLKGAIVYYGEWGHCKSLAEMIIKGLLEQGHEVALLEPETTLPEGMEFLVVGAPTKLGTLPREIRRFVARRASPSRLSAAATRSSSPKVSARRRTSSTMLWSVRS